MDFSTTLFRCHALGKLMTEPRSKEDREKGKLSATCIQYLIEHYIAETTGRRKDVKSKYIKKGLGVEEDAITLYSVAKKHFYRKNDERLSNLFITGVPDTYEGESLIGAQAIIDIKASWDYHTFMATIGAPLNPMYYWQGLGYMWLCKSDHYRLAYCLINTPQVLIDDEKRRLLFEMGGGTELNPDYLEACAEIDREMIFDDIPKNKRIIEFTFNYNADDILALCNRIKKCREWLCEFHKMVEESDMIFAIPDREPPKGLDEWPPKGVKSVQQIEIFSNQYNFLTSKVESEMSPENQMEKILGRIETYISERLNKQ